MGQSTDGILFFGYCWDEEGWPSQDRLSDTLHDDSDDDVDIDDVDDGDEPELGAEKEYLRRKSLWQPIEYPRPASKDALTAWNQNHDKCRELEEQLPFEMVRHCCSEAPMYGLAIRGTVTTAWRGSPQEIDPSLFSQYSPSNAHYDEVLKEVCEVLKLRPSKLGWWLVSDWS